MRFPLGGIDLTQLPSGQRPGTTAVGTNVRGSEPLTGRDRGGARSGIRKYIDEKVSGDHYIQHLNYIVTASGEAVGSAFDDIDLGDIGGLDVDNFGGLTPNEFAGWGGGGYQPALPRQQFRLVMSITDVTAGTFTSTRATVPSGATVSVVATLRNFAGDPQSAETIELHTSPSGRDGDGDSGVTVFDLDDPPAGTVTFLVTETGPKTTIFSGEDLTNPLNSVNRVTVRWLAGAPPDPTTGGDDGMGHCRGLDINVITTLEQIEFGGTLGENETGNTTFPAVAPHNVGTNPATNGNNGAVPGGQTLPAGTWSVSWSGGTLTVTALDGPPSTFPLTSAGPSPPACTLNLNGFGTQSFQRSASYDLGGGILGLIIQRVYITGTSDL
jgi:hypothetical protein